MTINSHCHIIYLSYLLCNQVERRAQLEKAVILYLQLPFPYTKRKMQMLLGNIVKPLIVVFTSRMKYVGFNYSTSVALYLLETVHAIRIGVLS